MNTIAKIGIVVSGCYLLAGTATAAGSVKAKYALKSYIHPIGVLSVRESLGNNSTLPYRWRGVYRADPNHPKIKAQLDREKSEYYGLSEAAVSVYEERVEAAGIRIDGRMAGVLDYKIKDSNGREWTVYARSSDTFARLKPGEFSVYIGIPGG